MMNKFEKLLEYGQSYWLDNLSREMITNGNLENRIKNKGLRGITSNPKIFMKAISEGNLYDEQIKTLSAKGKNRKRFMKHWLLRIFRKPVI